jgi:ABC-2 type transport system permease protein
VVVFFGVAPRLTAAVWGLLAACLVVGELGALLGLPGWVIDLSPFAHVPKVPGGEMTWAAEVVLLAVAVVLVAAGAWTFRRRDLATA